jgi:hypothetical protein
MCDICERIIAAKEHRYLAMESCIQHGDLQGASKKDQGYGLYLNYLYLCRDSNHAIRRKSSIRGHLGKIKTINFCSNASTGPTSKRVLIAD